MKLNILPRIKLANLPTPLQELPRLSKALNGPKIYVKRDDLTGLAFGGNKTRKLEYLMADAIQNKADYIVTGAGFQSNWCTQTAAVANQLGMKTVLIKTGPKEEFDPNDYDGNHLLHCLLGAEIKVVKPVNFASTTENIMAELQATGHRPFLLTAAGSTPRGVAGYINAVLELTSQAVAQGIKIDYLVHASGSGGTQAGLIIGAKAFSTGIKILASTTGGQSSQKLIKTVTCLVEEAREFLELNMHISKDDVVAYDEYAGAGYGYMTEGKVEAIKLAAETEGLFIDPVYTGSAMACLIGLCRNNFFNSDDVVVFLHTGGTPALFPYKAPLKAHALKRKLSWTIPPWSPEYA